MIRNYYTLNFLVSEFQFLVSSVIVDCFSPRKNILCIKIFDGKKELNLIFNRNSEFCSLYLNYKYNTKKSNYAKILNEIIGQKIQQIRLIPNERVIQFELSDFYLYFLIYGGAKANAIVTNKEDIVIDAYKNSKSYKDKVFTIEPQESKELWDFPAEIPILQAIAKSKYHLGNYYAEEFCINQQINPKELLGNFATEKLAEIQKAVESFSENLLKQKEAYLLEDEKKYPLLSLIPLKKYDVIEKSNSISFLIQKRIRKTIEKNKFYELYFLLKKTLGTERKKLLKRLTELENTDEHQKRIDTYKKYGELLISLPNLKDSGKDTIVVCDWDNTEYKIPLDKKITIMENAQKYFEKAKKEKEKLKVNLQQKPKIEKKLAKIEDFLNKVEQLERAKELQEIYEIVQKELKLFAQQKDEKEATKFRRFKLSEDLILLVGKNSLNNEELTFKYAKPHDLWLHVRGYSGSHSIIPLNRKQKVSKELLQKAGAITAYYSSARKLDYVPVIYTYRKYIKKPKGAPPGTVITLKEDVIFVKPQIFDKD